MKKNANNYVNNLVNKILNETLEERAESLVSRIKTNVNELGGMDDGHPKFGDKNLNKMSDDELDDLLNGGSDDESHDDDIHPKFGDKNLTKMSDKEIEDLINNYFEQDSKGLTDWEDVDDLDEGFDSGEMKNFRRGKDFSSKEFKSIPKDINIDLSDLDDDSNSIQRFKNRRRKPQRDDDEFDMEMYEGFDSDDVKDFRRGRDFSSKEFVRPSKRGNIDIDSDDDDSISYDKFLSKKRRPQRDDDEYDMELNENEVCECGGSLYEGECNECGKSYNMTEEMETSNDDVNVEGCKTVKEVISKQGGKMTDIDKDVIKRYNCDSLKGGQKKLDKNKNNKLDDEDFKLLRKGKKSETKEGSKPDFLGLDKDGNKKEPMKKAVKDKKTNVKETIKLTENELIKLIENIVKENELKLKSTTPRGLSKYNDIHKKDGKVNDDYIKSVGAKMKEYLKDGSKGEYNESPDHFPKGNGELAKMNAKKYTMSDDGKDFIDDYMKPGMENLDYDEIHPNEEWMENTIEGSEKTGNSQKYGNAVETDVNKRVNKKRKDNKFAKAKKMAYNKSPQPVVSDKTGDEKGGGVHIKLESENKGNKVLNEEFIKIQHLMGYNRKTQ